MKKILSFSITLIITKCLFAQTDEGHIVAFHPSAGTTIDLNEKKAFNIFTEYNDSLFESAQLVKYINGSYSILIKTNTGKSFEKQAGIRELDDIHASIERIKPAEVVQAVDKIKAKEEEERRKRERRAETAQIIGEIAFQSMLITLEVFIWLIDK